MHQRRRWHIMRKAIYSLFVVAFLAVLAVLFSGTGILVADGGGDRSPNFENPVFTVDGGGDRAPNFEAPVYVVDGGGDYAPDFEDPIVLADGGGDRSPTFENEGHNLRV